MPRPWLTLLLMLWSTTLQANDDGRKLWAYPRGVIVSSTVSAHGLSGQNALKKTLADFDAQAQKDLEDCAADARTKFADAATKSRRYRFDLTFELNEGGEASKAEIDRHSGEAELLPCFAVVVRKAPDFNFSPHKSTKPIKARIGYEVLLLTDKDAQGRGYQYLQGEERWEKALATHPEWFICKLNDDCVATNALCEPRAVAKAHLAAYVKAIEERLKPACRPRAEAPPLPRATCRRKRCALKLSSEN